MKVRSVELLDEDTDTEILLTKILGVALVFSLFLIVVLAIAPAGTSNTTEFYILGSNGTASDYPDNVTVGETATLQVGISNLEGSSQTYTLVVRADETTLTSQTVTVSSDERWEEQVQFAFDSPGRKHIQLELYNGQPTDEEPYRDLQLFVTVRSL